MDYTQVITICAIVATNIGTVLGLYALLDRKIEANRIESHRKSDEADKRTFDLIDAIRRDTQAMAEGIRKEMQDFHGRLCAIEERYRQIKQ